MQRNFFATDNRAHLAPFTRPRNGPLPMILEDALTGRVSQPPSKLNLGQVNELLDELAR